MKNKALKFLKENLAMLIVIAVTIIVLYATIGCPFRFFFGICCPGCGITRASLSLLRLDFAAAFRYNPLVYILPICLGVYIFRNKMPKKVYKGLCVVGALLFLGVYFYRLFTGDEYVYIDLNRGYLFQLLKDILEKYSN